MESIVWVLIGWNLVQGGFFLWHLQKFTNKIMSRDYTEYRRVSNEGAQKKARESTDDFIYPGDMINPPPNDLGF